MKKIIILLLLSLTLFGANVDNFAKEMGFERDYKTALTKAKQENKLLMMVLGADYCPWCRKFERKTLNSSLLKSRLQTQVVTLIVDKKFDIESFPEKFRTQFTPKVFFINPKDESVILDTTGYIKKKHFAERLDTAIELYGDK
ncbi:thioredoxin family protein [Sulfurimonas sp. SAG-AH-194-L11]|nr:thioredoxin fold domain-containing protein [Sulfurimonas sp. SAG-AH-194-L11]MDF1876224.1 thioredoxin family protein [Sulfurimonas sp. SAG-AH-194-L11]